MTELLSILVNTTQPGLSWQYILPDTSIAKVRRHQYVIMYKHHPILQELATTIGYCVATYS